MTMQQQASWLMKQCHAQGGAQPHLPPPTLFAGPGICDNLLMKQPKLDERRSYIGRKRLQLAADHEAGHAGWEEDREGLAMLQQASRLMKQVLLKGSPRSVSDADTAMFVDSGDDDSSQPPRSRHGCPQDVPTPTVSDEPSEIVHPSRADRHEQVVAGPIVQMVPSQMQISNGSRPLVTPMPPPPIQSPWRPPIPLC